VIISFFVAVHRHYGTIGKALRADRAAPARSARNTYVFLIPNDGLATAEAVAYLRALRPERVIPLYIGDPNGYAALANRWESFASRIGRLGQLPITGDRLIRSLRAYLRSVPHEEDDFLTVVVPEELAGYSVLQFMRRRSSFWLKASLLYERGIVVTNVPVLPEERPLVSAYAGHPLEPSRNIVLIPVSAVHAATARAVAYATTLNATAVEALFFSTDPEEQQRILHEWSEWGMNVPLSIVDAPFRDLTDPMLDEVRRHTSRTGSVVTVILPELVVRRWWENLFHNQTALFFKRLLLFEPGVVVTSVPFHIGKRR
jgi:hypothetical protein